MPTLQRPRFIFACSLGIGGQLLKIARKQASLNRENSQITKDKKFTYLVKMELSQNNL